MKSTKEKHAIQDPECSHRIGTTIAKDTKS